MDEIEEYLSRAEQAQTRPEADRILFQAARLAPKDYRVPLYKALRDVPEWFFHLCFVGSCTWHSNNGPNVFELREGCRDRVAGCFASFGKALALSPREQRPAMIEKLAQAIADYFCRAAEQDCPAEQWGYEETAKIYLLQRVLTCLDEVSLPLGGDELRVRLWQLICQKGEKLIDKLYEFNKESRLFPRESALDWVQLPLWEDE
jgi:hypothetical protein